MRLLILFLSIVCFSGSLFAQQEVPPYCNDPAGPSTYGSVTAPGAGVAPKTASNPLPRFATVPRDEYKVQVAILRNTDPKDFPFHPTLVARYRPCEQVWVVESRESFQDRNRAERLRNDLRNLGYQGAYITNLVAYN